MHLTDHISDVQLNEYLDNESTESASIEAHLSSCAECAARLTALQALFTEIESLPELELTQPNAARFTPAPNLIPQLPRWLTLTAVLQVVFAFAVLIFITPFVLNLLPDVQTPSINDVVRQLQSQWIAMLESLSTLRLASEQAFQTLSLPQVPVFEISTLALTLTLAGASLLWLVGNGLLLRKQTK